MVFLKPKSKEIDDLLRKLTQHPFQTADTKITQSLGRYKGIRALNKFETNIGINGGMVGLKPNVRIKKKGGGYEIEIF